MELIPKMADEQVASRPLDAVEKKCGCLGESWVELKRIRLAFLTFYISPRLHTAFGIVITHRLPVIFSTLLYIIFRQKQKFKKNFCWLTVLTAGQRQSHQTTKILCPAELRNQKRLQTLLVRIFPFKLDTSMKAMFVNLAGLSLDNCISCNSLLPQT